MGLLNGGPYASARAINAKGVAVGQAMDGATLSNKQARWAGGTVTVWSDCCGGGLGTPTSLNRSGQGAGYVNAGYDNRPLYWAADGSAVQLPPLPGGNGRGSAYDINDTGFVVGDTRDPSGIGQHAVIWHLGNLYRDLGFMGSPGPGLANSSLAHGINNLGEVVGSSLVGSEYHAFIWRNGNFTDLGPGAALDITDSGLVLGNAPGSIPVLWRSGVRENLRALSGAKVAYGHTASAINNKGVVVGYAPATRAPYQDTAVVWRNGKATDLGRYPGGTVSRAYGINDKGQIVGEGNLAPNGPMHALSWTLTTGLPAVVELQ